MPKRPAAGVAPAVVANGPRTAHQKVAEGVKRAAEGAELPQKRYFRQRAHINPLSFAQSFT